MRYIKSKKLSKNKYEITLEVTESDLLKMEDMWLTYVPYKEYQRYAENISKNVPEDITNNIDTYSELTDEFKRWTAKLWKTFWKGTWHKYG